MKKLFAPVLCLCLCLLASAPALAGGLTVWAIESTMATDYQENGQSQWMEEQTGVPITWVSTPRNGWYQAFQASVMANEEIDIYLYDFDTSEAAMLGTDMGYIIPLEDYITPENTPNIYALLEADPGLRERITAPDGHIYTLFSNGVYDLGAFKQKLWVNRYFLEAYTAETGLGMPGTTEAFEAMLLYFKTHDMNGDGVLNEVPYIGCSGVEGTYTLYGAFLPANSGNGFGCTLDENGGLVFAYTQEAYKEALGYVRGLYAQGLVSPDTFTTDPSARYALTSGPRGTVRAGVVTGVNASDVVQLSNEEDAMTYADYIAIPPLAGPDGLRSTVTAGEAVTSLRNAITIHCDDPAAAMRWLDAGYSEAARLYAVYGGVQGVDWDYAEGETLNGPGEVVVSLHDVGENATWNGQGIVYRVTEEDYLHMDASQLGFSDALCTYRANLAYRPYAVQNPWPIVVWPGEYTDEAAEYSELNSLISSAVSAYATDVILGRKDLEGDWQAYLDGLGAMGLARYLELTQLYITIG